GVPSHTSPLIAVFPKISNVSVVYCFEGYYSHLQRFRWKLRFAMPPTGPATASDRSALLPRGGVLLLIVTALLVLTQLYAAIPLLGPVAGSLGSDVTFALSTVFSLCYA